MPQTIFTTNDTGPNLTAQDQNFSVKLYSAPKSAGLDIDSASGWRQPGSIQSGSYKPANPTSVNSTKLGATNNTKSQHINGQDLTIPISMGEITPWGQQLMNKTDLVPVPTYGSKLATIDTAGGGFQILTLVDIQDFVVGDKLAIPIGTGAAAYESCEKRIEAIAPAGYGPNTIKLDFPLDEPPADDTGIQDVTEINFKRGGARLLKSEHMAVLSGDFDDTLVHFIPDARVNEGTNDFPNQNTGMTTFTIASIAETQTIANRKQPILMQERIYS